MTAQAYIKFRGASYRLAAPATADNLPEFVAASVRIYVNEPTLQRVARLIGAAKYIKALQDPKLPEAPQVAALEKIKTEVYTGLQDFFKNLQNSTAAVDKVTLGELAGGADPLATISGFLDKSTALKSLQVAKQSLAEAAKVFPELGKAGLDAKINELANYWGEWDKFMRGGSWVKGVMDGLKQMQQGREALKKKLQEVQAPIAQLVDKAEGAKGA